jgi:hypothetical protein
MNDCKSKNIFIGTIIERRLGDANSPPWDELLKRQAAGMWACDFLAVAN